ncbi:hypothetical protein ACI1US_02370 [Leucobacter sp. BZR 635]
MHADTPHGAASREWDLALVHGRPEPLPAPYRFLDAYVRAGAVLGDELLRFSLRSAEAWFLVELRARETELGPDRIRVSLTPLAGPPAELSVRELEIGTLISAGLGDKAIAARLGTSARTVSTQVSRLLAKQGLESRSALASAFAAGGYHLLPVVGRAISSATVPALRLDALVREPSGPAIAEARPTRPAPLRIGLLVTTGAFSDDGTEAAQGAELALAEVAAKQRGPGWRPFETVQITIDPLSPESVTSGLARLEAEDVDAVLSTYASALDPRILDFAAEFGRPFLHTNSWSESAHLVEEEPSRYAHLFQTSPTEHSYTAGLTAYLREAAESGRLRAPRISVIELDGYGCSVTGPELLNALDGTGIVLSGAVRVGLSVPDADRVARDALAHDPALVVVSHLSVDVAIGIQRAIRRISTTTPVYHLYTPSIPRFFEELGDDAEGLVWSTTTGRTTDALGDRFSAGYRNSFGVAPGWSQSSASYDQAQMLARAFVYAGSRRPADVSEVLRSVVHRGVNGTYDLGTPSQTVAGYPRDSSDRSLATPYVTYRYRGGRMSVLPSRG